VHEEITRRAVIHVRDNVVPGELFFQDSRGFPMLRQSEKTNAWTMAQPRIWFLFIPQRAFDALRIQPRRNFPNVKALRVGIVGVNGRKEQHANFIHIPAISRTKS
jgi:hypothetical protein